MKILLYVLALLSLFSCQETHSPALPFVQQVLPTQVLDQIGDSLYLGYLRCMTASEDHIFISDHHEDHVIMLDHDLNLVKVLGREGRGPGEFNGPAFSAVGQGQLWIDDPGNIRFQVYSLDGDFLKTVPINHIEDQIGTFGTFAIDHKGFIWLSNDEGEKPLVRMDQEGKVVARYPVQPALYPGYTHTAHLMTSSQQHLISMRLMDGLLEKFDLNGQLIEQLDLGLLLGMDSTFEAVNQYLASQQVDFVRQYADIFTPAFIFQDQLFVCQFITDRETIRTRQEGSANNLLVFDLYPQFQLRHRYKLLMPQEAEGDGALVEAALAFEKEGKTFLLAASYMSELLYLYELPQTTPPPK